MNNSRKVAIVTGASRGIGAGIAQAFRDSGYRVIANSLSIAPSNDPDILTVRGDIGDRGVVDRIISEGMSAFGRIDTLVNNAGIFIAKPFTECTAEDYAKIISVNLNGFFFITQAVVPQMLKQGGGHIVNITTTIVEHAMESVPCVLASLTKGGVSAATRSLAIEYAKRGIRVNAVAPGIIKTPMHSPDTFSALAALHPMGRMGEISDIVQAVMFLESAGFVTGETLHVDGGQSAGH